MLNFHEFFCEKYDLLLKILNWFSRAMLALKERYLGVFMQKTGKINQNKPILVIFEIIWSDNRQNNLKNVVNRRELHGGEMYKDRSKNWPP